MKIKMYYSPEPNEDKGGVGKSLEELLHDDSDDSNKEDQKSQEDLDKEAKEKSDKELADKDAKDKADKEKKDLEEKEKKNKEDLDKNKKKAGEDEDEDNEDNSSFWDDVAKVTGEKIDVDFGDVDPETPEGAVIYAKAFREKGISDFEEGLAKAYPREFRALQLAAEGIDPSILYGDQTEEDYSKITIDEKDISQQEKYLITSLKAKGNSEEDIIELVKTAKDRGKLLDRARTGLKELQDFQKELDEDKEKNAQAALQDRQERIQQVVGVVNSIVDKGEVGGLIIPETDRKKLSDRVLSNIRILDNKFYSIKEISDKEISNQIQAEYFLMKNGNLGDLVKRKADTENVKKLKRRIDLDNSKKIKGSGGEGTKAGFSLKDVTEE